MKKNKRDQKYNGYRGMRYGFIKRALVLMVLCWFLPNLSLAMPGGLVPDDQDAFDLLLSKEEKENFNDTLKTIKDSSTQTQEKFQKFLNIWEKLSNNFASLPPDAQKAFNLLNNAGIKDKVNSAKDILGQFNSGIDKFYEGKGKVDMALTYIDKFRPDKSNPFRSLEVMKNIFDEAESFLDKWKPKDPAGKTIVWLIRTGIDYFRTGITGAYNGLKNIQTKIKDRAAGCIGYVGGDATADSSDPKRKAFTDLNTGDIICYANIRPAGGEVWSNMDGSGVYIWFGGNWTRLAAGLGEVRDIFDMHRLAYGRVPTAEELTSLINTGIGWIRKAKTLASGNYRTLYEQITKCQQDMLDFLDMESYRNDLLVACHNSKDEFIAKYVFSIGNIRSLSEALVKVVADNSMIKGFIVDEKGEGIGGASVTITAGSAKGTVTTEASGRYVIILLLRTSQGGSAPASIKVTHPSFDDLEETTQIYQQCLDFGRLELKKKEEEITQLTITPPTPKIKINESVTFKVMATDADGSVKDVTGQALKSPKFTGTQTGQFTVTASYGGKAASAIVTVEEAESDIEEAIDEISKDEEEDICSIGHIKESWQELNTVVQDARDLNLRFMSLSNKFNKEINDQKSDPCQNGILAYCYTNAAEIGSQLDNLISRIRELSSEIIMLKGICTDLSPEMDTEGITVGNLVNLIAGLGAYENRLSNMLSRLNENGCDENEVRQLGETINAPEEDPDFIQEGGIMQEIPGDSLDNDANGILDNAFSGLSGFNVTFFIYDSGPVKDDGFDVSLLGYGNLMSSYAGAKQARGLNLEPGDYTAEVYVRSAPDNVGTFTLTIFENGVRIQSVSGSPSQGSTVQVPFTVKGRKD
jgi:hypothetical protein